MESPTGALGARSAQRERGSACDGENACKQSTVYCESGECHVVEPDCTCADLDSDDKADAAEARIERDREDF